MYIVGGIVLAVVFALIASQPQRWWRVTQGWAYRNPEANEPSGLVFGIQSVAGVVMAVVFFVGGFVLQHQNSVHEHRADQCQHVRTVVKADAHVDAVRRTLQADDFTVTDIGTDDLPGFDVYDGSAKIAFVFWSDGADESPTITCE